MDEFTHEIDELLISLNHAETDEWEGGLLCTPENRITVMNWLDKHYRLTPLALDGGDSAARQAVSTPEVVTGSEADSIPPAAQ